MVYGVACCALAMWRFRGYEPQPVTYRAVRSWLRQFPESDHKYLLELVRNVRYLTTKGTLDALRQLNRKLLRDLGSADIPPKKVIYVQVDEAGSSSHWVLAMLKSAERLESLGCTFLDSKNVRGLNEATNRLEGGAIIYVDDFAGSGNQFCRSRDFVVQHTVGNFVEFFLLPCICEEAVSQLNERGVEPRSLFIHKKADRMLRSESSLCASHVRERLLELSAQISAKYPLGYRNLGTMVTLSRNCPNSAPVLLRGSKGQSPFVGLLPRTTDLPPGQHYQRESR